MYYFCNLYRNEKDEPLYTTYSTCLSNLESDIDRVSRSGDNIVVWYGFFTTQGFATDSEEPYYTRRID
jgi:hypothetical protein